jgi:hypothetical protein
MTHAALSTVLLAPAKSGASSGGVHLSTTTLLVVGIVVVLGALAIWGFRAPGRSPHDDDRRIDD